MVTNVSSNKGIISYNPTTKRIRNFTEEDGMQSDEFNTFAFGKSPNGELFFGGINGLNSFVEMGFSDFLLTNVSRDGTLEGPDLKFLTEACQIQNANIISSGGISNISDVKNVKEKNAYGVILGKALYENLVSIEEAKKIS